MTLQSPSQGFPLPSFSRWGVKLRNDRGQLTARSVNSSLPPSLHFTLPHPPHNCCLSDAHHLCHLLFMLSPYLEYSLLLSLWPGTSQVLGFSPRPTTFPRSFSCSIQMNRAHLYFPYFSCLFPHCTCNAPIK